MEGDKYINASRRNLGSDQLFRSLLRQDENGNPYFAKLPGISCHAISGLNAVYHTYNAVKLAWTANGEVLFDIYYGASPLAVPDENTVPTTTSILNEKVISGLTASTAYSFYVRSSCGSAWSGPLNVTTAAAAFKFTIDTTKTSTGSTTSTQFRPTLRAGQTYNCVINWGDGNTTNQVTAISPTHTYAVAGVYQVSITGTFYGFNFNNLQDRLKMISIDNWGSIAFGSTQSASYRGCTNMVLLATDAVNYSNVLSLVNHFQQCTALTGNIYCLTSPTLVTVQNMFTSCPNFNHNVNLSNTSGITLFSGMFNSCAAFNKPILFTTPAGQSFIGMFQSCTVFNSSISLIDTTNAVELTNMFLNCPAFNQPVSHLSTDNVVIFSGMFSGCSAFNQSVSSFTDTSAISINRMFYNCAAFNKPVNNLTLTNVNDASEMFFGCVLFNQSLSSFNTGLNTSFNGFLYNCASFNQSMVTISTASATDCSNMFSGCFTFNSAMFNLTANVTSISYMFQGCSVFNQNLNGWNVSGVEYMDNFLNTAISFTYTIEDWEPISIISAAEFMNGKSSANYSAANLDAIYNKWSLLTLQPDVVISFGTIKYTPAGAAGKAILQAAPNTWFITDGGI